MKNLYSYLLIAMIMFFSFSCKKLVNIDPPANQVTPDKIFDNEGSVNSATANIYTVLNTVDANFIPYVGVYTDELVTNKIDATTAEFTTSSLTTANSNVLNIWRNLYSTIYKANAVVEGLQTSSNIRDSIKNQCLGEAKFMRAYSHFMLINIFGDSPLITSTNAAVNANAERAGSTEVYNQIVSDLIDATKLLAPNYPSSGEKVRANKWAACALLAKVYLFMGDYPNAEIQANAVINSGKYSLSSLTNTFLANSSEAILQLWSSNGYVSFGFIPTSGQPSYPIATSLLNAFEANDNRKTTWLKSTLVTGTTYYYPFKYRQTGITTGTNAEYIMYLRLGEIYLIRAEARAQLKNLSPAADDLNLVRNRAGLGSTTATTQGTLLTAITHERQVELFTEGGNRFFDLKRNGTITSVISPLKSLWKSSAALFPIPFAEISTDHNLIQNPGYSN